MVVMPTQAKGEHPDEHEYLVNFFPMEGNRSIACMGSWGLDMPRTVEDFAASAERLRTPMFAEAMAASEPMSEVHLTRSTGNKWRRYDRLPLPPQGLVSMGDAVCAFNPFYGQGMSAARSALLLRNTLQTADTLTSRSSGGSSRFSARRSRFRGRWPWPVTVATSAPPAPRPSPRGNDGSSRR